MKNLQISCRQSDTRRSYKTITVNIGTSNFLQSTTLRVASTPVARFTSQHSVIDISGTGAVDRFCHLNWQSLGRRRANIKYCCIRCRASYCFIGFLESDVVIKAWSYIRPLCISNRNEVNCSWGFALASGSVSIFQTLVLLCLTRCCVGAATCSLPCVVIVSKNRYSLRTS